MEQYKCKGCTQREVGCHSRCKDYLDRSKAWAEEREKIRKIKQTENDCVKVMLGLRK